MAIITISDTIDRGKLSIGYSANDNDKGNLFGRRLNSNPIISPVTIAMVTDALIWSDEGGAQTDAEEREIANYLIWLTGAYGMRAAYTLGQTDGGGTVTPGGNSQSTINPLDWLVSDTASSTAPLADGDVAVTFDGTNDMPDLRGYNINFFRGGVTQNTTPLGDGSTYYYWNKSTGLFQLFGAAPTNGAAQTGELMRITPDLVGGLTFENFNLPQTIYLSADGTYTLADGYMIYKIAIKPTAADTVRIGTTLNGEEIMMDKLMTINVYGSNGVTADVFADGSDQTVYFTGFTASAQINIYLLPI
jgi:hypothetical protein